MEINVKDLKLMQLWLTGLTVYRRLLGNIAVLQ